MASRSPRPAVLGAARPAIAEDLESEEASKGHEGREGKDTRTNESVWEDDHGTSETSHLQSSPRHPHAAEVKAPAAADAGPMVAGLSMKWISLAALTIQTSGQALLIKWSRSDGGTALYVSSTVVCLTEVLKTATSLALVVIESGSLAAAARSLRQHFTSDPAEVLKAAVPALIYTVQNNLMFYSFDKLSAAVQQVLYQMKILTTAGLGVLMLGQTLKPTQWTACFLLMVGVAFVQWPRHTRDPSSSFAGAIGGDQLKGFVAVLLACLTSGFAAVYIQKMLQQTTASIWMRNTQFGLFGSIMALLVAFVQDGDKIQRGGFTQGYSPRVVAVIAMNALGGLLCAVMLKFAGATLGCFSTALSIVLTCTLSATFLQDYVPDELFVLGTFMTVAASLLYGLGVPDWLCTPLMTVLRPPGIKSGADSRS